MELSEPVADLFTESRVIILDYSQIPRDAPAETNIKTFFENTMKSGLNPRLPENRQSFNDKLLGYYNCKYLVGTYGENRVAMLADTPAGKEGRTIHMAIDIFTNGPEPVLAPASGIIVRSGYEEGFGEYGNYLILQPYNSDYSIFFGHLSQNKAGVGATQIGQTIGTVGDYTQNENGGWSRHLHVQILKSIPPEGTTPDGYSTEVNYAHSALQFPNPMNYFPEWQLQ